MSLGNREDGRSKETKSEYLADGLCKELRSSASCVTQEVYLLSLHSRKERRFFMKNKKALVAVLLLLALVAVAAVCWFAFGPEAVEGSKTLTVDVTHKDGTTNTFTIQTDAVYLGDAMKQEGLLDGTDGPYGLYVLTVDGETVDESNQEWWGYTKSGEQVNYGVDTCPIEDGEHYEFTLNIGW